MDVMKEFKLHPEYKWKMTLLNSISIGVVKPPCLIRRWLSWIVLGAK